MTATAARVILVLGMHRSGTSALAGLLHLLGVPLGDALLPGIPDVNPKGFWEHAGVVDVHERVLAALGSSWHDERELPANWWLRPEVQPFAQELREIVRRDFGGRGRWAVKDPRLCRLLPLWRLLLREDGGYAPGAIVILRDPREVAQSLAIRDGIPAERSCLLWLRYLLDAEKCTRDWPRVLVTFEELLRDWRLAIARVDDALSLGLPYHDPQVGSRVEEFLEPSLRHHATADPPSGRLPRLALEVYRSCADAKGSVDLGRVLAPLTPEIEELAGVLEPWSSEVQLLWHALWRARSELAASEARVQTLSEDLARVKSTVSWRVTAPLRVAWNLYKRIGRGRGAVNRKATDIGDRLAARTPKRWTD